MAAVNKEGRTYTKGKAISTDFRETVVEAYREAGAPPGLANFKGKWKLATEVAKRFKITAYSVMKFWDQLCLEGNVEPKLKDSGRGRPSKLHDTDLEYIDFLYKTNPSMTIGKIIEKLKHL